MTIVADARTDLELVDRRESPGWLTRIRQFARRNPLGAAGALVIIVMFLLAAFADVIAPYNPVANAYDRLHSPPSLENCWSGSYRHSSGRASAWCSVSPAPISAARSI
jgi:peptide/nickel transport system permease protein